MIIFWQWQGGAALIQASAEQPVDFEKQIRPLLKERCAECHGANVQKSSLRLDVRHAALKGGAGGPAIEPGNAAGSELFRRVTSLSEDDRMPPEGERLSDSEIELLRGWIASGANWPETEEDREAARDRRLEHWAFQPLSTDFRSSDSDSGEAADATRGIDSLIADRLKDAGLTLSSEADRRTQIRRLTLDLHGLPPSPEEVAAFESETDPNAYSRLVDRLLASPRYGERWAQHWLDVIRYADTHGFEVNTPRDNAWHYRDYVIRSLNDDKPYDQFVREQLAGDVFQADEATGFMVASAVLLPGQIGADDQSKRLARQDALDEIIVGTSSTLLGLTIGCARCHDHKFDPITTHDYYALQAFFAGVEYGDRPVRNAASELQRKEAADLLPEIQQLTGRLQKSEPPAFTGRTLIIDELNSSLTRTIKVANGPGINPEGTRRGYRDDPGASDRVCNLSGGRYTWWNNVAGEDVLSYNPGVAGRFHLWISWGAHGSGVHTRDARYVLDSDGDLTSRDDQHEVAQIDQYYPAGLHEGETERKPLWSGLQHAGIVDLQQTSKLILRGGNTGSGITADVIVLQEVLAEASAADTDAAPADRPDTAEPQAASENRAPSQHSHHRLPSLRVAVNPLSNTERFKPTPARFVRFTTFETINENQHEPCLDELEIYSFGPGAANVGLAEAGAVATSSGNYSDIGIHQLKHINDGRYGNDHSWISNIRGGGWVQVQLPSVTVIDRIIWSRDRNGKFRDRLPVRYAIQLSEDGETWTTVARHDDRLTPGVPADPTIVMQWNRAEGDSDDISQLIAELNQLQDRKKALETPQMVFGGTFREPDTTFVLRRGDPEQRQEETGPSIPELFKLTSLRRQSGADQTLKEEVAVSDETAESSESDPLSERDLAVPGMTPAGMKITSEQHRRLALARWISSAENPLTARVMVNRIWMNHMGRGLVDTPNDFGVNGSLPSHPELLDWLANEFIRSGWSVKHIHRLIVTSAVYRQSHQIDPHSIKTDADNRLYWRFTSRRMEAESIRDSMLAVTGELNLTMGGPGFSFFKARGGLDGFPPIEEFTPNELRRMIYSHRVRMEQVPVFGAFDCPDAGQSTPRRNQSTTAIQALNLMNSQFVADRAVKFAARVQSEVPSGEVNEQVHRAFRLVSGRNASNDELAASGDLVRRHGLAALCRVLLNSSEFLFIP